MSWYGWSTPDGLIAEGVGTGKESAVMGLVAHWTYTFDFDGTPETFFWAFTPLDLLIYPTGLFIWLTAERPVPGFSPALNNGT